jgi:hypothetical protein
MKKIITVALLFFLASCSTITKVSHKLSTSLDSLSKVKKDTSSNVKKDSATTFTDQSLIVTNEHIVNQWFIPGNSISAWIKLGKSDIIPVTVATGDSTDYLSLSYNKKDSTVTATLVQKPTAKKETIDRTTTSHLNKKQSTETSTNTETKGKTATATKVDKKSNLDDSSKIVKPGLFRNPVFIIGLILAVVVLIIMGLFKFKIL